MVILCLLMIGFIVFYCMRLFQPAIQAKNRKDLANCATYSEGTLKLTQRCADIQRVVKLVADTDDYLATTEKKVIFTSATVGGITTGGFDTVGGDTYVAKGTKNGKYRLDYQGRPISTIQLTDSLYQQALHSPIKEYLHATEKKIVVNSRVALSSETLRAMSSMPLQQKENVLLAEGRKGYPDYSKAAAIYKWISAS